MAGRHLQPLSRKLRRHAAKQLNRVHEFSIVKTISGAGHHLIHEKERAVGLKPAKPLRSGIRQGWQSVHISRNYQVLEIHLKERRLRTHPSSEEPALKPAFHAARRLRLQNPVPALAFTDTKIDRGRLK